MKDYRLDKTVFKAQTFEEADMANVYGPEVPFDERLKQAFYLICRINRLPENSPLKVDRTIFSAKKWE